MTAGTMQEIEKTATSQGTNLDSKSIKSIQLPDGWHNVKNCSIVPFAVSNSPVYNYFPTLKYENSDGQTVYTPLKQILSFSQKETSNSQS